VKLSDVSRSSSAAVCAEQALDRLRNAGKHEIDCETSECNIVIPIILNGQYLKWDQK